jgi:hypothetical protein
MIDIGGWLFAAILLVGLVSLVVVFQDRLIYFPPRYSSAQLEEARACGVQELRFQTSQGDQAAFFWQNEDSGAAPQNVWLLFGGNGDVALAWMDLVRSFASPHTGYLLIDYPGYGSCAGRPNPQTILRTQNAHCKLFWRRRVGNLPPDSMRPGTLARRGCCPPVRSQTPHSKNSGGFDLHQHGRYGAGTDPRSFGAPPPASLRQRSFSGKDSLPEARPGDLHLSRSGG